MWVHISEIHNKINILSNQSVVFLIRLVKLTDIFVAHKDMELSFFSDKTYDNLLRVVM